MMGALAEVNISAYMGVRGRMCLSLTRKFVHVHERKMLLLVTLWSLGEEEAENHGGALAD